MPSDIAATPLGSIESTDAEETVISYLLRIYSQDPAKADEIFKILAPGDFGESPYRAAYSAMVKLIEDGIFIEVASLKIYLETNGQLWDVGGLPALRLWAGGGLLAQDISHQTAVDMAKVVLDRSRRRIAIQSGKALIALAGDYSKSTELLIEKAEEIMLAMALGSVGANDRGEDIGALALAAVEDINAKRKAVASNSDTGIRSSLADLNAATGGYRSGELIIIAGRPGCGKSALAMNEAVSIARQGLPVLKFSLEMKGVELATRVLGGETNIDLTRIRDGLISDQDFDKLSEAATRLKDLPLKIFTQSEVSFGNIASIARRVKARSENNKIGAILIDYLQLMQYDNSYENIELGKISKAAKQLAMELDCPIFLLSQLSRGVESRQDKRPVASDLRGSGSLEQDGSLIIMVYRDIMYNANCLNPNIAELIIVKQRNGKRGTVKAVYDGSTTTFKNLLTHT
jgi:replicative DNA helicase